MVYVQEHPGFCCFLVTEGLLVETERADLEDKQSYLNEAQELVFRLSRADALGDIMFSGL